AAKDARVNAELKKKEADLKAKQADDLALEKAELQKRAIANAMQRNPNLKDEPAVIKDWQNQLYATYKKRFEAFQAALKELAQEVIEKTTYDKEGILANLNNYYIHNA